MIRVMLFDVSRHDFGLSCRYDAFLYKFYLAGYKADADFSNNRAIGWVDFPTEEEAVIFRLTHVCPIM